MPNQMKILVLDGSPSLTFYCAELPADDAVVAAGHEPNGYFWEGLARYLLPHLMKNVELDSEAGMFAAYGTVEALAELQQVLESYLDDGGRTAAAIREAEESGFAFDD